jgi:enterochelin esterase-like enzyme
MMNDKGELVLHRFKSEVLESNPLGDPHARDLAVYLPPGYNPGSKYPAVFCLIGYGGTGRMFLNTDPFMESIDARMDRLVIEGKAGPMILVMPDCFTRFGGNQYINSQATGMYEDHIVRELVPFVKSSYNISGVAVMGHSSGGYGALSLGMRYPDVFQAVASHAGDAAFEYCYLPDFPKTLAVFRNAGGPKKWLEGFIQKGNKYQNRDDMVALGILGMAAHYSPNAESELGVDFPFDLDTGEMRQDVWSRWLSLDPVRMIEAHAESLKKLDLVYLDCGTRDEFNMIWGCRMIHSKMARMGVEHHYEEFDGGHAKMAHRYDLSLPAIHAALRKHG